MCNHVIDAVVDTGLAIKLDEPVWMDRSGSVCSEENAFGCQVHHHLRIPDLCICGNVVSDNNISMKGDGHACGELLLTAKKSVGRKDVQQRTESSYLLDLPHFQGNL